MQVTEEIACPFCGQNQGLLLDTSVGSHRFVTDCEVCCRPFEVNCVCESGEVVALEAISG